ncbi:hypothetical protein KQX54_006017 [Cotesia glomerata]|uniref:Uncharacterized protein n=1 Tax=Cotesia glomerata TaxID=32391 RepID=A0AAV7I5F2_COTGL|nr:hypothetical protein KQX54_006017 [Cotesia glomerata]
MWECGTGHNHRADEINVAVVMLVVSPPPPREMEGEGPNFVRLRKFPRPSSPLGDEDGSGLRTAARNRYFSPAAWLLKAGNSRARGNSSISAGSAAVPLVSSHPGCEGRRSAV